MEDRYVTPGNQERGWNDPPQFSYGLQKAHGPQRNLLNKRAAPGTGGPPMTPPSSSPLAPSSGGVAPPPPRTGPHPVGLVTPPPPLGPMKSQRESSRGESSCSQSGVEPDVEAVMSVLNRALEACRQTVRAQVCNDVAKRLRVLEDNWKSGRLSQPVRRRMDNLAHELQTGDWDSADELHRSLMVDHVTEVSQWMVGVKRLIAETRQLSPELLEPLLKPEPRPEQDPKELEADPVLEKDPKDLEPDPVLEQDPGEQKPGPVSES